MHKQFTHCPASPNCIYALQGPQQSLSLSLILGLRKQTQRRKMTGSRSQNGRSDVLSAYTCYPFILIFVSHLFVIVYAQYWTKTISSFSGNLPPGVLCARSPSCLPQARRRLSGLWLWIVISMFIATAVRSVVCTPKRCMAGIERPVRAQVS